MPAPTPVVHTVGTGPGPDGVAVTPNGKTIYAANNSTNTVSVIDARTDTDTVTIGSSPHGVGIQPSQGSVG
ncbi:YncE family protein [Streptomyces sp. NPDC058439]|uniref:YncE family protein n=1 Tax=Streptomyces sp. NPDC058439 TaxID=3346500 RepID=UPI003661D519